MISGIAFARRVVFCSAAFVLVASLALAAGCGDGDTPVNNNNQTNTSGQCPSGYILVPKGTFTMGIDPEDITGLLIDYPSNSGPAHTVTLTADFCMSKTEITVAEYRQCRSASACMGDGPMTLEQDDRCNFSETNPSRDNHPVNCLTYEQAREYCQALGGDLPTEAQWIRAAQGDDRRHFAWGNSAPDCSHANFDVNDVGSDWEENGYGCAETLNGPFTWTVGNAPAGASPYGLLDMTGNLAEFVLGCGGIFQPCDGELGCVDPQPPSCDGPYRVALGGCLTNIKDGLYSFYRGGSPDAFRPWVGMRCVQEPANR